MSNFTDFAGGGANSYTPSTAVVYAPVTAGQSLTLGSTGDIYPDPSLPSANPYVNVYGESLNTSANNPFIVAGLILAQQYGDTILPNGITIFSIYIAGSGLGSHMVTSLDNGATLAGFAFTNPAWVHEYATQFRYYLLDEDATYYYMGYQTQSSDVNTDYRVVRGTVSIAKSTGVITNLTYESTAASATDYFSGMEESSKNHLRLARGGTVWVQSYMKNNTEATGIEIKTGTTSLASNYATGTTVTTSDLASQFNGGMLLGKINDAAGTFLTITTQSSLISISVLTIAADGSHSFSSPISQSYAVNGLSSDFGPLYTRYFEKSPGNFVAVRAMNYTTINHQEFSYTSGSTFTDVQSKQTLPTTSTSDGTVLNPYVWFNNDNFPTHYDPTNNYLYSPQAAAVNAFLAYYDYAIKFDLTNNTSELISGVQGVTSQESGRTIYVDPTTNVYYFRPSNSSSFDAVRGYYFDTSLNYTRETNAVILADATEGETVNIVLKDGITSKATLPSSKYLFKQDQYFPLDVEGADVAAFGYLKLLSNNAASVAATTVNAATVGDDVLTIRAPEGKYLIVYIYESINPTQNTKATGVRVDGNSILTGINSYTSTVLISFPYGRLTTEGTPHICKSFSFYKTTTNTEDADARVYYYIGEPA